MSIPSKTTIDNLPPSVSQRYAAEELSTKGSKFFQEISNVVPTARPQIAVLAPAQESQLEALTGFLGKTHSLALYTEPDTTLDQNVFTHTVFPSFSQKDKDQIESGLQNLKNDQNSPIVNKVLTGIATLSDLNKLGDAAFANCRRLKQG
jgi:hypothetical protein